MKASSDAHDLDERGRRSRGLFAIDADGCSSGSSPCPTASPTCSTFTCFQGKYGGRNHFGRRHAVVSALGRIGGVTIAHHPSGDCAL